MVPLLVAHRGYAAKYPENTLPAIRAAVEAGACLVEFDIQFSKDIEPVLLHDASLERTCGLDASVFEKTFDELKSIVANEPQRFPGGFQQVCIPSLRDVVEFMRDNPQTKFLIEVKTESVERFGEHNINARLAVLLKDVCSQVVVISYDEDLLGYLKHQAKCEVGYIMPRWNNESLARAGHLKPDYLVCNKDKIPADFSAYDAHDWKWVVYEITDPQEALAFGAKGVHCVETMDIGTMLQDARLKTRACNGENV